MKFTVLYTATMKGGELLLRKIKKNFFFENCKLLFISLGAGSLPTQLQRNTQSRQHSLYSRSHGVSVSVFVTVL